MSPLFNRLCLLQAGKLQQKSQAQQEAEDAAAFEEMRKAGMVSGNAQANGKTGRAH